MKIRSADQEFRTAAAAVILKKLQEMSVSAAARDLEVSREAIYGYKRQKYVPTAAVIQRACAKWGVTFSYRGYRVDSSQLGKQKKKVRQPEQLNLSQALESLRAQRFEIQGAKRVGNAIEFTIRMKMAS